MSVTLEELRSEHDKEFVGDEIARLLTRIAQATAVTYPVEYSDCGTWNKEAIEDLLQDWMIERLLGRKELTRLIKGAGSLRSLRAGLTTSLRHFLADRRKKATPTRLFKRMTKLLESSEEFMRVGRAGAPGDQLWTLSADPDGEPARDNGAALHRLAGEISNAELRLVDYKPDGKKSSPELRDEGIRVFLQVVLGGSEGALSRRTLMEVLLARLGIDEPTLQPFDDEALADLAATAANHTRIGAAAYSVAGRLGERRASIVVAVEREKTFDAAAASLNVSEAEVTQAIAETVTMISAEAGSDEETAEIYRCMLETLFDEDE